MHEKVNEITFKKILLFFISLGIAASFVNFFHNRSLWLDEAMLSLNIVGKTYSELLKPLNNNQVAPIGYLYIEKLFSSFFDYKDWSLRLFPFISYLISLPLFYLICKQLLSDPKKALYATALFSTNLTVIYYSFEVKQYSSDVLFGLLITLSSLNYFKKKNFETLFFSILSGILAVWFSNAAIIFLFVFGLLIIHKEYKEHQIRGLIIVLCWIVSFLVYYFLFMFHHPTQDYMLMYWTRKKAFIPFNLFSVDFYLFILSKSKMFFTDLLYKNYVGVIFFPIYLSGIWSLRKNKKLLFLVLMPLILHLILSLFKLYPFDTRFILYQLPFIIITLVEGIFFLFELIKSRFINTSLYFTLFPLLLFVFLLIGAIPIENEEMKNNLNFINKHIQPNDNVYIYGSASSAFKFYIKSYPQIMNKGVIFYGSFHRDDWSQYNKEVLNLKGRSWLIFSQVYHLNGKNEEDYLVNLLKENGYKILSIKKSTGTNSYEVYK
jgi:hypothetical protein